MTRLLRIATILVAVLGLPGAGRSAEAHWPETLTIGTASPGGTYHDYGEGLARLLTRKLGLPVAMRETEGPVENLKLLEAGEIQLAFVTLGIAQQGWSGSGDWTGGQQFRGARALFPMYDTPFQFMVAPDSAHPVRRGSGRQAGRDRSAGRHRRHLHAAAVQGDQDRSANFATGSWTDLAAQLSARKLDALVVVAGVPVPEVTELEKKGTCPLSRR